MTELFLKGRSIGNFQGVLFDKDGTISHSEPYLIRLAQLRIDYSVHLFSTKGKSSDQISTLKQLLSKIYGLIDKHLDPGGIIAVGSRETNLLSTATIFCLLGDCWPDALKLAHRVFTYADKNEKFFDSSLEKRLLPGAKSLLNKLNEAGIKCALISNDSDAGIKNFLRQNLLLSNIEIFWSAESRPTKPDPEAVIKLCNELGVSPSNCVLIGDADSDLRMARDANIGAAIGYLSGWEIPPKLTAHQYLIENWNDLTVKEAPKMPA